MARAPTQKRPVDRAEMRLECLRVAALIYDSRGPVALAKEMYDFVTIGALPAAPPIRTRKRVPAKPAPRE